MSDKCPNCKKLTLKDTKTVHPFNDSFKDYYCSNCGYNETSLEVDIEFISLS